MSDPFVVGPGVPGIHRPLLPEPTAQTWQEKECPKQFSYAEAAELWEQNRALALRLAATAGVAEMQREIAELKEDLEVVTEPRWREWCNPLALLVYNGKVPVGTEVRELMEEAHVQLSDAHEEIRRLKELVQAREAEVAVLRGQGDSLDKEVKMWRQLRESARHAAEEARGQRDEATRLLRAVRAVLEVNPSLGE